MTTPNAGKPGPVAHTSASNPPAHYLRRLAHLLHARRQARQQQELMTHAASVGAVGHGLDLAAAELRRAVDGLRKLAQQQEGAQ